MDQTIQAKFNNMCLLLRCYGFTITIISIIIFYSILTSAEYAHFPKTTFFSIQFLFCNNFRS